MSESTLGIIRILAGLIVLLLIQPPLSRLKSPLWGAIVPLVIVAAGVYAFGVAKLPLTAASSSWCCSCGRCWTGGGYGRSTTPSRPLETGRHRDRDSSHRMTAMGAIFRAKKIFHFPLDSHTVSGLILSLSSEIRTSTEVPLC